MSGASTKPRVECIVEAGDQLGETPLWDSDTQELSWIDIERPRLHRLDGSSRRHETSVMPGTYLGCQALARDATRLIATDLRLQFLDAAGGLSPFAAVIEDGGTRLNDGRVDARGRLWIGTMDNGLEKPLGSLYRVDPDGMVHRMLPNVIVSNGIAFSPAGDTLYFTDTRRYVSYAFDLDLDDGTIRNQRTFADYSQTRDRPDGACMDVDGCLWAAFFGGGRVVRYRPDGRIDLTIELPVTNPTCLCFGGSDLKTLYVTSATKFLKPEKRAAEPLAGALFAIEGVGQGLQEHRFG